ncbi:MAG: GspE/PulE family protein [Cyclobacteriaceae bacterium]
MELKQAISTDVAWRYRIIPKGSSLTNLEFYTDSQHINDVSNELEVVLGKSVELTQISSENIDYALNKHYLKKVGQSSSQKEKILDTTSDTFIENIIEEAKTLNCSDIHLEPFEKRSIVRMRLDGKLIERFVIPSSKYAAYVNKLKIMSDLDIAEKRLPQDGRILYKSDNLRIDIRVSILPTLHGEKVVLRLLGSDASDIDMTILGLNDVQMRTYRAAYSKPSGIILISGPTGSGKTTTLYATLKELNQTTRNILTIEDPIEYTLEGINQVQLREKIGLDFASALKTFLRQDPDIIMVGEIRDVETAKMATRAALTGHLVLSTIHTNSALGIISRLEEMGINPFLIADTLNAAIAQRLVRTLCKSCREEGEVTTEGLENINISLKDLGKIYKPKGCSQCYNTGYTGRKAIYEILPIDNETSEFIKQTDIQSLKFNLSQKGVTSL